MLHLSWSYVVRSIVPTTIRCASALNRCIRIYAAHFSIFFFFFKTNSYVCVWRLHDRDIRYMTWRRWYTTCLHCSHTHSGKKLDQTHQPFENVPTQSFYIKYPFFMPKFSMHFFIHFSFAFFSSSIRLLSLSLSLISLKIFENLLTLVWNDVKMCAYIKHLH